MAQPAHQYPPQPQPQYGPPGQYPAPPSGPYYAQHDPTAYQPRPGLPQTATVNWPRLASEAHYLTRANGKPASLAAAEKFSATYRRGATELARLKAFSPNRALREMAENAVAVANLAVYRRDRVTITSIGRGVAFGLPDNVRKLWPYHLVSVVVTMIAAAIAFFAVLADPTTFYMFVDRGLASGRDPYASHEYLAESLGGADSALSENIAFSLQLFAHNTKVAFLCYAVGIMAGLPTLYLLITNGLMLGGFTAVFYKAGLMVDFLAWILPHGVPEFGAIFLCGGAGLALGHRLLNPGNRPRGEVLIETAQRSSLTAAACAPLLLLAGFVEGVFRQSDAPTGVRYALFGFLLAGMLAWLLFVRERGQQRQAYSLA